MASIVHIDLYSPSRNDRTNGTVFIVVVLDEDRFEQLRAEVPRLCDDLANLNKLFSELLFRANEYCTPMHQVHAFRRVLGGS